MIDVQSVSKSYRQVQALSDVSFRCEPGRVTGLLGPNGAGKSTLMRIMVGLTRATAGRVTIGGQSFHDLRCPGRTVGVMLDASAQHSGRTGVEILSLGAQSMGLPKGRVSQVLDRVGLTDSEAKRRLGKYSLGMRQRLGIAHALLGDPEILIFDEPANGLDPSGIRWIRDLLDQHADQGGTVLLSSHLINEIELVADDLVLIGHGRVLSTGTKDELISGEDQVSCIVAGTDLSRLRDVLVGADLDVHSDGVRLTVAAAAQTIGELAVEHRLVLTELHTVSRRLEDEFLRMTSDTAREGAAA